MTPDDLAQVIVAEMRKRYPTDEAPDVIARATTLLVEAIVFVVDRATSDEVTRRESLHMIASVIDDASTQARRAFPFD